MAWSGRGRVAQAVMVLVAGSIGTTGVPGQEPAFFYNNGGMRYTEAAGVYHYVFACKVRDPKAADATAKYEGTCWPAFADMILKDPGSGTPMKPIAGVLLVSAEVVHFTPNDPVDADKVPDLKPAEVRFTYLKDKSVATMDTSVGTLLIKLRPVCEGCKPGPLTPDPAKQAQVDGEYAEIQQSVSDYAALAKRVKERVAFLEVAISAKTQPGLEDVADGMGAYADLDDRLAPLCGETARACLRQFSAYETCKKADLHAECGAAPSCESSCTLTEPGFKSLGATWCRTPKDKVWTLYPDWSAAGEKLRAQQKAYREKNPVPVIHTLADGQGVAAPNSPHPAQAMDFMGKPIDPAGGCTVEGGYAAAMMLASSRETTGQAGAPPPGTPLDVSQIAGGVAASNILKKVNPVYPAVAKAAHVTGTVVLHVLITEQGEVTNLTVVSGPPLLQAAAVDAVKQWRYKPYVQDGVVRKVETLVMVNFNFGSAVGGPPASQ